MDFLCKFQPTLSGGFMGAYPASSRFAKYLSAAAGATIQACLRQTVYNLLVAHPADARQVVQFHHSEGFEMHVGKIQLQLAQEAGVVIELKPRVKAADDVQLP